jgi:hypothetical protein
MERSTNNVPRSKPSKIKFSGAVQVRGMIRRVWRHRYLEIDSDGVLRYYEAINPLCSGGGNFSSTKNRDQVIAREMQAFSIPDHLQHENTELKTSEKSSACDYVKTLSDSCSLDDGDHVLVEQPRHCTSDESLEAWDDIKIPDSVENYSMTGSSLPLGNVEVFIAPDIVGQLSMKESSSKSSYQSNMNIISKSQADHHSIQPLHHRIHEHRPKAVMTILSARLIDVNTLIDIHVGLPKGTFGFVFCGRQIFTEMQSSLFESSDNTNNFLDTQSVSGDHYEISGDICHPLSILNVSDHYFDTSRDYLCSVSTEEEARKWVAALKWAAKVANCSKNKKTTALEPAVLNSQRNSVLMTVPPSAVNSSQDMVNSLLSDSSTVLTDSSIPHGYTIVAKVKRFFVKKTDWIRLLGIKCEVVFEISLLLLGPNHVMQRSVKRGDNEISNDSAWSIEQRTIYRTFQETKNFASLLVPESKGDSSLQSVVVTMQNLSFTNVISIRQNLAKSIECADAALRIITSDPQLCDSLAVKQFLGLTSHPPVCDLDEHIIISRKTRSETLNIDVGQSVDDFVKNWLLSGQTSLKAPESLKVYVMLLLRNPIIESILSVKLAYFAKCAIKFWWSNPCCTIRIRADALLTIFGGFFYLGYNVGSSMIDKHRKNNSPKENDTFIGQTEHVQEKSAVPLDDISIHEEISLYDSVTTCDDSQTLSSPLPMHPNNGGFSCWSCPDHKIFNVRGKTYLKDRIKHPSGPSPFKCRGVDMWLTDNPERNISRLPCVLGGKLGEEDTFLVNFLLPFGNFVMYFSVSNDMPDNVANVWKKFKSGDQLYRDSRLKLLPVVVDGPWIVKKAVGNGTAPALLSQSIPLQYYFTMGEKNKKDIYEVDVIISASRIAKGILNVVKSHTNKLTIALGIIIEATTEAELPEVVLCSSQLHSLDLEHCPHLPKYFLDDEEQDDL